MPKIAAITAGLVLLCWGGFALMGRLTSSPASSMGRPSGDVASYAEPTPQAEPIPAATTGPAAPTTTASEPQQRESAIEKRIATETQSVAFDTRTVRDHTLTKGTRTVRTPGVPGVRTLTYELTLVDGVQTARKLVRSVVTKEPVTEVIAIGTRPQSRCDPNYKGACVPVASDVDCAGSGDGPKYVEGPVRVIGEDIYGLDPDQDGVGCD